MTNDDRRHDIEIIERYITKIGKPKNNWRKHIFDQIVYERWAAQEALDYIGTHTNQPVVAVLRELSDKFDTMSLNSCNERQSYIFSVGYDTIEDIICELLDNQNRPDSHVFKKED